MLRKLQTLTIQDWTNLVTILGIIIAVISLVISVYTFRQQKGIDSAQLMLDFNKDLSSERNSQIITAIESHQPIFRENGGSFTTTDIDNYLGIYELMNNVHEAHLITDDMLYNAFSYIFVSTFQNKEIIDYLNNIRKDDQALFYGSESLAKDLKSIK